MKLFCLLAALVALAIAQDASNPAPHAGQKKGEAAGSYIPQPPPPQAYLPPQTGFPGAVYPQPQNQIFTPHNPFSGDQNVCDFEASILVTLAQPTFGGQHGGYQQQGGYQQTDYQTNWWQAPLSQAQRLKCTDVAVLDDDSCTTCCRLAARRSDSTIAEEDISGILVDKTQLDTVVVDSNVNAYTPQSRHKRQSAPTPFASNASPPGSNNVEKRFNPNIKCMCCGLRRQVAPVFPQAPPVVYSPQQVYAQPGGFPQQPPAYPNGGR